MRAASAGLASSLSLVIVSTCLPLAHGAEPKGEPAAFEVLVDRALPSELAASLDVRWASDDSVYLAAGRAGIVELAVDDASAKPHQVVAGEDMSFACKLGVSEGHLVNGIPFGPIGWKARNRSGGYAQDVPMAAIVDLDVGEGRVWMLGSRRIEGEWAPEGAILWSGELPADGTSEVKELQPLVFARSGAGAREMADCWFLDLGAVRHLGEGRWAVVPGVQPGAFVYAADGKLERAWQTDALGFVDRCDLDPKESDVLAAEPEPRLRWHHQRRILDDVLSWDGWPGLLIRVPDGDGTRWELQVLDDHGIGKPVALPLSTRSTFSHLKGDVRGDRVALLVVEYEIPGSPPQQSPRLLVLKRRGKG